MTFTRSLLYLGSLTVLFGTISAADVRAQTQKYDYPHQKSAKVAPQPEPAREQQREQAQGGYQAPAPTGALRGPKRELGLSGGEIELPAIRLRLPRVRLPSFSLFMTPPQMETERAVAPMVQQFQEQVSIPTGSSQPTPEPVTDPGDDREQSNQPGDKQPYQKAHFQGYGPTLASRGASAEVTGMRNEMDQFERRIDQKLDLLAQSLEVLVAQRRTEERVGFRDTPGNQAPARLPVIDGPVESHIRPTGYLVAEPMPKAIYEAPRPRRLPPVYGE